MATTPTVGLNYQVVNAGTAVNALDIQLIGGYVTNPIGAPGPLFIDPTTQASVTANGTTISLTPGQTFWAIPNSTLPISVNSNFNNHAFVSVQWK